MAAQTGLSPVAVAGLDARDYLALESSAADRWTWTEELLATLCELTHQLIGVQLARAGVKPPRALRIPRPGESQERKPEPLRVSARGLRAMLEGGG